MGALAKLQAIRQHVPPPVRAASARALAFADPPAVLVQLFAEDDVGIAAPVLRTARLRADEWIAMLPGMSPAVRSLLRHRRDLPPAVGRALESFGSVDFVLGAGEAAAVEPAPVEAATPEPDMPVQAEAVAEPRDAAMVEAIAEPARPSDAAAATAPAVEAISIDWTDVVEPLPANEADPTTGAMPTTPEEASGEAVIGVVPEEDEGTPGAAEAVFVPPAESTFVSIASVALGLPVVAEALRQSAAETPEVTTPAAQFAATGSAGAEHPSGLTEPLGHAEPEAAAIDSEVAVAETEPVVAEAGKVVPIAAEAAAVVDASAPESVARLAEVTLLQPPPAEAATGMFQIAELVARIDAYQRQREDSPAGPLVESMRLSEHQPALFDFEPAPAPAFRFETDASGIVRWVEGAARAPLIGLSLDLATPSGGSQVDGVAAGAFRRRAGFANARLIVEGNSDAAGQWRITGIPVFDRDTGRFTGYRGSARRPRPDETAEPAHGNRNPASDALRQLVHELRTPTNAIAGFAEMIETQMLGPVPHAYRAHAATIRSQAGDLLTAIDDIDMAARIDSKALDLRPTEVPIRPLLTRIADDLKPLASLRGTILDLYIGDSDGDIAVAGDDRAVERLIGRLMATLVASGAKDERIGVAATLEADGQVALAFDRPAALASYAGDALLAIDAESEAERDGAPLLGTGFALRLARNLAVELHGSLTIGDKTLTLRLPAAVIDSVEQVSSS